MSGAGAGGPTSEPSGTESEVFLAALLAGVPGGLDDYFYLWTLADKISHSYPLRGATALADAAELAAAAQRDVYVGVAVSANPVPPHQRVKADEAKGIFGLWSDIDTLHPVHKKVNLPATDEEAMELLMAPGLEPTILVKSGHGLQVWWLFEHAWIFGDDSARVAAGGLAKAWNDAGGIASGSSANCSDWRRSGNDS